MNITPKTHNILYFTLDKKYRIVYNYGYKLLIKENYMKTPVENFGTRKQWQELGSDMTKLRGKIDVLDVKIDNVNRQAEELARFTDTIRIVTFTAIMFLMTYLLVNQFIG